MNKAKIDLAPLFDSVCIGEISLSELQDKLEEYSKQVNKGTISLCYKGIPIFKSNYLVPESDIKC